MPEVDDVHDMLALSMDISQEDFLLNGGAVVAGIPQVVDDDDDEAYVPDSLRAFVEDQDNRLNQARENFISAVLPDPDLSLINSLDEADIQHVVSFPDYTLHQRSSPRRESVREVAPAPLHIPLKDAPETYASNVDPVVTSSPVRTSPLVSLKTNPQLGLPGTVPVPERGSPSLPKPATPTKPSDSVADASETIPALPPPVCRAEVAVIAPLVLPSKTPITPTAASDTIAVRSPAVCGAEVAGGASLGPHSKSPTIPRGDVEDGLTPIDAESECARLGQDEKGQSPSNSGLATDLAPRQVASPAAVPGRHLVETQLPLAPPIRPVTTPVPVAPVEASKNIQPEGVASPLSKGHLPKPSPPSAGGKGRKSSGSAPSTAVKQTQVAPLTSTQTPSPSTAKTNPSILRSLTDRLTRPTASSASRRMTPRTGDRPTKVAVSTPSPGKLLTLQQSPEKQIVSPLSDPSVSPSATSFPFDGKTSAKRTPNSPPRSARSPAAKAQSSPLFSEATAASHLKSHSARSPEIATVAAVKKLTADSAVYKNGDDTSISARASADRGRIREGVHQKESESPRKPSTLFATRATVQSSPRISSPSLSPDFLGRLTQPTAASRARSAATPCHGLNEPREELAPSPRRVASSCESCCSSPSKESKGTPRPGSAPRIKVTGASQHLTKDTEAGKARRNLSDAPEEEASSPRVCSTPSPGLLSRLTRETVSSRAARNAKGSTPLPVENPELPTVHSRKKEAMGGSDGSPPGSRSQLTGLSPQRDSLGRLTQETASSSARRASPTKHEISPPGIKPKATASASIRSAMKSVDRSMAPSDERYQKARASHHFTVTQTHSFDEVGSIAIPNACSSLTQDSIESVAITSQSALSTVEASKARNGECPPSSVRRRVQHKTIGSAPTSSLSSQSRLLQGTASSRSRTNRSLPPSSANTERSRNLKDDQKKKAMSLAIDRARRKSGSQGKAPASVGIERMDGRMQSKQHRKSSDEKENKSLAQAKNDSALPGASLAPPTRPGEKRASEKVVPTLAQSTDVLRNTLRSDQSISTTMSTVRKPTIPKTPNFATTRRYGGKEVQRGGANSVTLAQSTDLHMRGLRSDSSTTSLNDHLRRLTLTTPQSPHFATSTRSGFKTPALRGQDRENTLVNSTLLLKSGLRAPDPALLKRREMTLTVPITPKFHATSIRKQQKSTEERELEHIERYRSNPFQARSTARSAASTARVVKQKVLNESEVDASHLETDNPEPVLVTSRSQEEEDLREMKKQFRARPAPKFAPKPIVMQKRLSSAKKPVPLTSESRRTPSYLLPRGPLSISSVASNATAPHLMTPGRSAKRQAVAELSRRKAEAMALQREKVAKDRQRERIRQEILKAEASRLSVPANSKPFVLRSEVRGEQYQRKFEEKVRQEEDERRRLASFHAREYHKSSTPPDRKRPERIHTEVQPFNLSSIARHEEFEDEFQRKMAEQDAALKRQSQFKAKPVPKTTYCYTPIASPINRPPWSARSTGSAKYT